MASFVDTGLIPAAAKFFIAHLSRLNSISSSILSKQDVVSGRFTTKSNIFKIILYDYWPITGVDCSCGMNLPPFSVLNIFKSVFIKFQSLLVTFILRSFCFVLKNALSQHARQLPFTDYACFLHINSY